MGHTEQRITTPALIEPPIHPEVARQILAQLKDYVERELYFTAKPASEIINQMHYRVQLVMSEMMRQRNIPEVYWEDAMRVTCVEDAPQTGCYSLRWPPRLANALGEALAQLKPPENSPLGHWQKELEEGLIDGGWS